MVTRSSTKTFMQRS